MRMCLTKVVLTILTICLGSNLPVSFSAQWYVDSSSPQSGDGRTWETAVKAIQQGIDRATHGDTVIVAKGVYVENILFKNKNIVLRSTKPQDPEVVASTIIDGGGAGAVVSFYGREDHTCVLSGFTIQNGRGRTGAGINGAYIEQFTHATIENNVIRDNRADNVGGGLASCYGAIRNNMVYGNSSGRYLSPGYGGGLYECNGVVENNVISRNFATMSGGGLYGCIGTFQGNVISRNEAQGKYGGGGGGLADCDGILRSNVISENIAYNGGGLWECGGIIESNLIRANFARLDGGGLLYCSGRIRNNIISANKSTYGGGLYDCDAILDNNTICYNEARQGAALFGCQAEIRNCIIWGNSPPEGVQTKSTAIHLSDQPTYSCIQDWTGGGDGNITEDPSFVDADNGDFRLLPDSPCIDAGLSALDLPQTDIAGMRRIMFGGKETWRVDMGAYEYYINDLKPGPTEDQTTLTWSSLADRNYCIFYSDDLLTWHLADAALLSAGDTTTSWIDDGSKTGLSPSLVPRRFYRIRENP